MLRRRAAVVRRVQAADDPQLRFEQVHRYASQIVHGSTIQIVLPVLQTVVFCFLKTDLIRAFYAGALPSFAECKQLAYFQCNENQFSGA